MASNTANPLTMIGDRRTGESVRRQNVMAVNAISNIVRSSLGPVGLDKLMIDDVGDITVTNDGATILKLLEVTHPAARILVELAQLQDQEVGDGTTTVVLLAAELLKAADQLVEQNVHPTTVMAGYKLACREACKFLSTKVAIPRSQLNNDSILNAAKTSLSSKLIGLDSDFFASMAVEAALAIRVDHADGSASYPTGAVNILKAHGKSMRESRLIRGYALNLAVPNQQLQRYIENAKIALVDFNLQKIRLKLSVQILIDEPDKLEDMRKREADITRDKILKILAAGANVVITTGGIDDLCMKYLIEGKCLALRRCKKSDLRRIAKATGAQILPTLSNLDGDEVFEASMLGTAGKVYQQRICDDEMVFLEEPGVRSCASILLRGANDFYVDEMERSMIDALRVVQRVLESGSVLPGGGACEAALSVHLENLSMSLASREQLAVAEFANALLSIPRQLALNAALDAVDLVGRLRAKHASGQSGDQFWQGLDLVSGGIRCSQEAGVIEPTESKIKSIKFATEAAITILRIDDIVKIKAQPPADQQQQSGSGDPGQPVQCC